MPLAAGDVERWIRAFQAAVTERRDELTQLDAAIGDADHGTNMDRGMRAVVAKLDAGAASSGDVGALLKAVGMTLISTVGGASGPLYGTFFLRMGAATTGRSELDAGGWAAALDAGVEGVVARGKAAPGDKTMVDALLPAAAAFREAIGRGSSMDDALQASDEAASAGMRATIPMVARKGRASYLGERSAGHQDPGATSSWLLLHTAAGAFGVTHAPATATAATPAANEQGIEPKSTEELEAEDGEVRSRDRSGDHQHSVHGL